MALRERVAPRSDSLPDALNIPSVVNLSEVIMFKEIPASKKSISKRNPIYGVGINDAGYKAHIASSNKTLVCPYYIRWSNMIKRCYSDEFHDRNPTYIECSVCDEWLLFSNFKSWMVKQNWEGMELDKDVIFPDNKLYSPDTCCFIPKSLNALLTDSGSSRGKYPQGVSWHKATKKFQARVRFNGKQASLGYYKGPEEASEAYIKAKTAIIIKYLSEQTDTRIANGLGLHVDLLIKGKSQRQN